METAWTPPAEWKRATVIDSHAAGEPLRVIVDGLPPIPGETMLLKRRYAQENLEPWRTALMWEPRGHADMYGAILTNPVTDGADLGVLFLHNQGYSTMCGHGIIALTKVVLDTGIVQKPGDRPELIIDTPAGRIVSRATRWKDCVRDVSFANVPSFVYRTGLSVSVTDLGLVTCDIAFGGAFYAFCDAVDLGLELIPESAGKLIKAGQDIKSTIAAELPITHPLEEDLGFLYGTIFTGPAVDPTHHSRNVCIFADGEVDRSPTGTGVSARAALHFAKGELSIGTSATIESIIGTTFEVEVTETTQCGSYQAVVPRVTGAASITGVSRLCVDPQDPLGSGFFIR